MNDQLSWAAILVTLVGPLFYIAALVYVARQNGDGSPARKRAIIAVAMILILEIVSGIGPWVVFGWSSTAAVGSFMMIWHLLIRLGSYTAHGILISAVFVGRGSVADRPADSSPPWSGYAQDDSNPYHPPVC